MPPLEPEATPEAEPHDLGASVVGELVAAMDSVVSWPGSGRCMRSPVAVCEVRFCGGHGRGGHSCTTPCIDSTLVMLCIKYAGRVKMTWPPPSKPAALWTAEVRVIPTLWIRDVSAAGVRRPAKDLVVMARGEVADVHFDVI